MDRHTGKIVAHHELEVEAAERDARRIEALRARREGRVERFLDARQRTVGLDIAGIEAQIEEKKRAEEARKAADREEFELLRQNVVLARAIEEETKSVKREQEQAAQQVVSEQASRKTMRDTADLEGWRKAPDAHMCIRQDRDLKGLDPDPRLGPASVQVFDGEDPLKEERVKMQQVQLAAWTRQAEAEKAARKAEIEAAERERLASLNSTVTYAEAIDAITREEKRERAAQVARENLEAAEVRRKVLAEKAAVEKNLETVSLLTMTSKSPDRGAGYGFLAGDLSDSVAAFSDRRIRVDHYRGLPPEASVATRHLVEEQINEHKSLAKRKREEALKEHEENMKIAAQAARIDRAAQAAKEKAKREAVAVLERQVAEAAERKRREEAERRGVAIDDAFFAGFGRSDR